MSENNQNTQNDNNQVDLQKENNAVQNEAKKPVSNLIKFGIPALILIILAGAVFAFTTLNTNDPVKLLGMSYIKNKDVTEVDASFDMKFDVIVNSDDPETVELAEMFKHINVTGNVKANTKSVDEFQLEENIVYNYDDIELLTLNIFMDKDQLALGVPTFVEKMVFADYDKAVTLAGQYSGLDLQFSIKDYYSLFTTDDIENWDAIASDYGLFLMEKVQDKLVLGEDKVITTKGDNAKEYTCKTVELKLTMDEYYQIYFALIDKIIADERLEGVIKTKLDKAIEISKENGVLELMGVTEEDLETIESDFSEGYKAAIEEIKTELDYDTLVAEMKDAGMADSDYTFAFYIDKDKNMRGFSQEVVMSMPLNATAANPELQTIKVNMDFVYNAFENVTIETPDATTAFDITEDPEGTAMAIMMEAQMKMQTYMEERPQLMEIFSKLQGM